MDLKEEIKKIIITEPLKWFYKFIFFGLFGAIIAIPFVVIYLSGWLQSRLSYTVLLAIALSLLVLLLSSMLFLSYLRNRIKKQTSLKENETKPFNENENRFFDFRVTREIPNRAEFEVWYYYTGVLGTNDVDIFATVYKKNGEKLNLGYTPTANIVVSKTKAIAKVACQNNKLVQGQTDESTEIEFCMVHRHETLHYEEVFHCQRFPFRKVWEYVAPKSKERQTIRISERNAIKSELDDLKAKYSGLHTMADEQSESLPDCVVVDRAFYCYDTSELGLHRVVFGLEIDNRSVFGITFDATMEGNIEVGGHPLLGGKQLIYKPDIAALKKGTLTIEQRLNTDELGLVERCKNGVFGAFFYFNKLKIRISVIDNSGQYEPAFLKLPETVNCNKSQESVEPEFEYTKFRIIEQSLDSQYKTLQKPYYDRGSLRDPNVIAILASFSYEPSLDIAPDLDVKVRLRFYDNNWKSVRPVFDAIWYPMEYESPYKAFSATDTWELVLGLTDETGTQLATYEYMNSEGFLSPMIKALEGTEFYIDVELICKSGINEPVKTKRLALRLALGDDITVEPITRPPSL
jgi:hypothetical protein